MKKRKRPTGPVTLSPEAVEKLAWERVRLKRRARRWKRLAKLWYDVRLDPELRARKYRTRKEL